jgi:FlaA1/EpsC-like NDP-sugar epimerase
LILFYIIKLIFEKVKRIVNKTSYDEYFKDKTIFITGASSGIGESLCK